jgi:hypothetical protein
MTQKADTTRLLEPFLTATNVNGWKEKAPPPSFFVRRAKRDEKHNLKMQCSEKNTVPNDEMRNDVIWSFARDGNMNKGCEQVAEQAKFIVAQRKFIAKELLESENFHGDPDSTISKDHWIQEWCETFS